MSVVPGDAIGFTELPGRSSGDPLAGIDTASSLRVVRVARTEGRRPHRHPHSEEIVYVRSGRGTVWIDDVATSVTPGTVIHIPTGSAHATVPDEGEEMELICFFPHPDLAGNLEELDTTIELEEQ